MMNTTVRIEEKQPQNGGAKGAKTNKSNKNKGKRNAGVKKDVKNTNSLQSKDNNKQRKGNYYNKNSNKDKVNPMTAIPILNARNVYQGAASGDPRFSTYVASPQYTNTALFVDKGLTINPVINIEALVGVAAALVARALVSGFYSNIHPNDPINAANFVLQILVAAASNNAPVATNIPAYVGTIAEMLKPRTAHSNRQEFQYAFSSVPQKTFASTQIYGGSQTTASMTFGSPSSQTGPEGLNVMIDGQLSNDMQEQAQAFNRMVQHLSSKDTDPRKAKFHVPLSVEDVKYLSTVHGSMAGFTRINGTAFGSGGGFIVRLGSEVPIIPEVAAVFSTPATSFAGLKRAPNYNSNRTGGPMELMYFTSQYMPKRLAFLAPPVVKFVNFNDLFYAYCKALVLAIQIYVSKPDALLMAMVNDAQDKAMVASALLPGITMQQAKLAFRNAVMLMFSDSQWAVQSITSDQGNSTDFLGLSVSANTYPVYLGSALMIPAYLQENMRALLTRTSRNDKGKLVAYLPVIGVDIADTFNGKEFDIILTNSDGSKSPLPLFATSDLEKKKPVVVNNNNSPNIFEKANTKRTANVKAAADDINIIDGSTTSGMLQINNAAKLAQWTNALNATMNKVSKFVQGRTALSDCPSANMLCQLGNTIFLQDVPSQINNAYGTDRSIAQLTYSYSPSATLLQGMPMITPFIRIPTLSSDSETPSINLIASSQGETYTIREGHALSGVGWADYLDMVAFMCVGDGETTNATRALQKLSQDGEGGLGSFMIDGLLKVAQSLAPMAGAGADSLLGMI